MNRYEPFRVSFQLSELDSSSESDFDSYDDSDSESDASWETEEEVEMSNSENGCVSFTMWPRQVNSIHWIGFFK